MNGTEKQPLVSVIVPTYDRGEELKTAIESVVEQSYEKTELIVVDDFSPTPVAEVLSDWPDRLLEGMTIVRHDENRGANAARNTGIQRADGEYIAFLDDDDWWEPTKIEKQVQEFRSCSKRVGVVYTGLRLHFDDGVTSIRTPDTKGDLTREFLLGNPVGSFSVVMVRREAIEHSGLPDKRMPNAQDREWYIRLSKDWEFSVVREPLVNKSERRSASDQLSKDFEKRRNVSYPLIIERHRSLAREYGWLFERKMIGQFSFQLGYDAFWRRRYGTARWFFLKAIAYYPFTVRYYVGFFAAVIGRPLVRIQQGIDATTKQKLKSLYFSYVR